MLCKEMMKQEVESFRETDSVLEIARRMRDMNIGFAPICDRNGRPVGALTDRDIAVRVCAEDRKPSRTRAGEVMSRALVVCRTTDDLQAAERLMSDHHKSRIMVVDEQGRLVGIISLSDLALEESDVRAIETMRRVAEREVRP